MIKTPSDLVSATDDLKNNIFSNLKCHNIGIIDKFYPETQTADVILLQNIEVEDFTFATTLLAEIPVMIYGSHDAQITLPDLEGTFVIVLTFDRNIDAFMETGTNYTPETFRMHNITDSIALTTMFSLNNPIANYDVNSINMHYQKTIEEVLYDATIKNLANRVEIKVQGDKGMSIYNQTADSISINTPSTINVNSDTITIEGGTKISITAEGKIEIEANDEITIKSPVGIKLDTPEVEATGNLSVDSGASAAVPCGNTTLVFADGILTGVE